MPGGDYRDELRSRGGWAPEPGPGPRRRRQRGWASTAGPPGSPSASARASASRSASRATSPGSTRATNAIVLGRREDLETRRDPARRRHVRRRRPAGGPRRGRRLARRSGPQVRIRHRAPLVAATVRPATPASRRAAAAGSSRPTTPVWAIAPGQACVLYDGDAVPRRRPDRGPRPPQARRDRRARRRRAGRVTIGPALPLALLVGLVHTALYVLIRGDAGGRLPLTYVAAASARGPAPRSAAGSARPPHDRRLPADPGLDPRLGRHRHRRGPRHPRPAVPEGPLMPDDDRSAEVAPARRPDGRSARSPTCPSCWAATRIRSRRFLGGLVVGALVGAALAGAAACSAVAGGTARADPARAAETAPPVRYHCADGEPHPSRPRFPYLTASEIRSRFLEFFAERGHTIVPSASLVPAGDQTLLFTNSGHGPVQGRADRRREARLRPRGRLPALPAGRRQAQRLRGGRPDAAPPHAVRDARQLELRRLLQARGDPLGVGVPDPRPRDPRRTGSPRPSTRPTTSPTRSGRTRSACRPSASCAGATSRPATRRTGGAWPTSGRAARARSSTTTAARTCPRARSASRTTASTARAGSRSGTSCSWSSSSTRTAR